MPDREKVIKGLYACTTLSENGVTDGDCKICPYDNGYATGECWLLMNRDALALLKEQESELSYRDAKKITHTATKLDDATCPSCGNVVGEKQIWEGRKIFIQWKYCIFCGQKLNWEGR